jgi:enoyl-[acyl-carrier-protein] reductase (NADH)
MKQQAVQSALAEIIPVHRVGQPSEIQGAALLLASDAGSFITGQQIVVDGGTSLAPSSDLLEAVHKACLRNGARAAPTKTVEAQ